MVYLIMSSAGSRNQGNRSWYVKAIAFFVASTSAALSFGLILGMIGSLFRSETRAAAASLGAVGAIIVGAADILGRGIRLPQVDRETAQRMMHWGAIRGAVANGALLGMGFVSRIGFWLWYVVPMTALLAGDPLVGAIVYGCYGFTRGIAPLPLGARVLKNGGGAASLRWILDTRQHLHRLAAAQLMVAGVVVAVGVGT